MRPTATGWARCSTFNNGDEQGLRVVRSVDQSEVTLRAELAKVSDDPTWIDEMIAARSR